MDKPTLDEVLEKFGDADYTKEFWDNVNKHIKEENLKYETEERDSQLAILKNKDKVFGPLIGG